MDTYSYVASMLKQELRASLRQTSRGKKAVPYIRVGCDCAVHLLHKVSCAKKKKIFRERRVFISMAMMAFGLLLFDSSPYKKSVKREIDSVGVHRDHVPAGRQADIQTRQDILQLSQVLNFPTGIDPLLP